MPEVTTMRLRVDLGCDRCYKKIKKLLCKFPEIRDQAFFEKENTVTIKVVCCSPDKIRDKLICKGGKTIKSFEIIVPEKTKPPPEKTKPPPEKPKPPPEKPKPPPEKLTPPPPPPPAPAPPPPEDSRRPPPPPEPPHPITVVGYPQFWPVELPRPPPPPPDPAPPPPPAPAPPPPPPEDSPTQPATPKPPYPTTVVGCTPFWPVELPRPPPPPPTAPAPENPDLGHGGPCHHGYGIPHQRPSSYDGYVKLVPSYDESYGGWPSGCRCNRSYGCRCEYFTEENPACTIM